MTSKLDAVNIAKLITAKVEILKLKTANSGYDWSHVSDSDRAAADQALSEIDKLLAQPSSFSPSQGVADDVWEMRLCESRSVYLRPDVLYRFSVAPGCKRCVELAEKYADREKVD
jgi:hypothetical protein